MRSELMTIVQDIVLESHIPAKALADEIGKPYSTLMREVNPYDAGAKLGAETMLQIMRCTNNVKPLEYMAEKLGYSLAKSGFEEGKPYQMLARREGAEQRQVM